MEPRNCKRCGKIFGYNGVPICEACRQQDEDDFKKVKKYLYDNPGASMREVSEACEVSVEKITRFLREGRLEVREGANITLECEKCGRSIRSGRMCPDCSKQLERDMSRAAGIPTGEEKKADEDDGRKKNSGMRYLRSE